MPSDFLPPPIIRAFRKLACFAGVSLAHGAKAMLRKSSLWAEWVYMEKMMW